MSNRQILDKESIVLYEKSDSGYFPRIFTIHCTLKPGASVICYDATCKNGKRGVLKEFYPTDAISLVRDENGTLVHQAAYEDAKQRYIKACQAYIAPYMLLFDAKKKTGSEDLATFTPSFDIYYGSNESTNASGELSGAMYIFTPEQRVTTFEEICHDIHENPYKNPEQKLLLVMTAIESLAKCTCAMHCNELLHRDIKPSNFGFIRRRGEVLTQAISLFDIDSVCSVYDTSDIVIGTPHYLEPEALRSSATNQTDIYAIGATLFYAIAASEATEESQHQYIPAYYDGLSALLSRSHLLHASESNSHPRLKSLLLDILTQCLAPRRKRYCNCEALLDDLDKVMKWLRKEETLDISQRKNTRLALQYHLYNHPLFEAALPDSSCTNVLVIGFGNYGQKFLDICLQAGQMIGRNLHVSVISDNNENNKQDPAIYLESRPELDQFFAINRDLASPEEYGSIRFVSRNLSFKKTASACDNLSGLFQDCRQADTYPQYVFIALGSDELNLQAAQTCRQITQSLGISCSVNFIREKKVPKESFTDVTPLYVSEDVKNSPSYAEIERMAFNVHLVWKNTLNLDMSAVRKEFRKPYNHDSCISNVLSIRYKLYSLLHVDLSTIGVQNAARLYAECLQKGESEKEKLDSEHIRNQLIWIEHRRWVTEKLCDGWRAIHDLSICANGVTKDERYKRHICIVKSRPDQELRRLTAGYTDTAFWNCADDDALAQLDELDRLSVLLHRVYEDKANEQRTIIGRPPLSELRALILPYPEALAAFEEWALCIAKIWNKNREAIYTYAGLKNSFLSAVAQEQQSAVKAQVKSFETIFLPVLSSLEYRSYKKTDEDLIDSIPFILTYSENISLIIPYTIGDNAQIFANVASATVINPQRILYLAYTNSQAQYDSVLSSLASVAEYMNRKHLRASVDLLLICSHFNQSRSESELQQHICRLTDNRIKNTALMQLDHAVIQSGLFQYLSRRVRKGSFWAAEINDGPLSATLSSFSKARHMPAFCFDSQRMCFQSLNACDIFSYIRKKPVISVSDMLALNPRIGSVDMSPEFFADIDSLWEQYSKNTSYRKNWKTACRLLKQHARQQDNIVLRPDGKSTLRKEYQYILPIECYRSVQKLIDGLLLHHVLEQGSMLRKLTGSSFEVYLLDRTGQKKQFDMLFANPYKLRNSDDFDLSANADGSINIEFDDLFTSGLNLHTEYMKADELASLLSYFESKNYIRNLTISDGTSSFIYATKQIKHLLTSDKRILEAYIYHKLKELGQFDDIVGGLKTDLQQRFGVVATKGFRSLFVQCIAEDDAQNADHSPSLKNAQKYGINELVVFVSDSSRNESPVQNISKDSILISDIRIVDHIGQFLLASVTDCSAES